MTTQVIEREPMSLLGDHAADGETSIDVFVRVVSWILCDLLSGDPHVSFELADNLVTESGLPRIYSYECLPVAEVIPTAYSHLVIINPAAFNGHMGPGGPQLELSLMWNEIFRLCRLVFGKTCLGPDDLVGQEVIDDLFTINADAGHLFDRLVSASRDNKVVMDATIIAQLALCALVVSAEEASYSFDYAAVRQKLMLRAGQYERASAYHYLGFLEGVSVELREETES